MKKELILLFFLFSILLGYSQNNPQPTQANDWSSIRSNKTSKTSRVSNPDGNKPSEGKDIRKNITVSISSGISTPSSNFKNNGFASNGSFIEFDGAYYFSNFGIGLSVGQYKNPTDSNLDKFTNSIEFTTINTLKDWKINYYGFGPQYKATFNKIEATFLVRTGIMSIKPTTLESNFNTNVDVSFPVYSFTTEKTANISYFSTAIKIGYNFSRNLSLFATADYLSALSNELTITEKNIQDSNRNGIIDAEDLKVTNNGASIIYDVATKNSKPQTTNFGIGINYTFRSKKGYDYYKGKSDNERKRLGRTKYSNITLKRNQVKGDGNNGIKAIDHNASRSNNTNSIAAPNSKGDGNNSTKAIDHNASRSNNTNSKVEVRGWDPKDKTNRTKETRKIILTNPKNNSSFKTENELKNFNWTVIGKKIIQPKYIFEVSKIGNNLRNEWMLIAKTTKPNLKLAELFNQNKSSKRISERLRYKDRAVFTDGKYKWRVTETTTGLNSNYSFFSISNCEIDFTIANDSIECLGYEGANRKFKICFDATYSSPTGDLTYVNAGSGLTVYDQTYAPISYTLVSPNPTLVTQTGATTSTVSYCFEVTVPSSVTSIGFGLQGDDLDPSPIDCKPGVSLLFDELPSCLCDDCDDIQLSFDNFNISLNGTTGNQFNFNGNINVNVPIYGMEFQIQSYSYSASPSACTEGVSSVEESGMILMPGTTINGSTALQLFNETISGSASSNDNATKDIKYTSNTALTGSIPVNLTIGLPGPISGLDPSCCVIDYTVCIKVKIFYEEGNCKSCVFTHCFEFNNQ